MSNEWSSQLKELWARCQGEEEGLPWLSRAQLLPLYTAQIKTEALKAVFRHRGPERPQNQPRRVHRRGVVGVASWRVSSEGQKLGGLLGATQSVLIRLSNSPEPTSDGVRDNESLVGVAVKFLPTQGEPGNVLFISTPEGIPHPDFFSSENLMSTVTPCLGNCQLSEPRRIAAERFGMAVAELIAAKEPHPHSKDRLPLGPPLSASDELAPWGLTLKPALRLTQALTEKDFVRQLRTASQLRPGTKLYDVVASSAPVSSKSSAGNVIAEIYMETRFEASLWADRCLYFPHPSTMKTSDDDQGGEGTCEFAGSARE